LGGPRQAGDAADRTGHRQPAAGLLLGAGRINSESGTNWGVVLRALLTDSDTNVLSTPSIVTMDNEEAEIKVGQEVPFLTGQFAGTGAQPGVVNPFQTIERQGRRPDAEGHAANQRGRRGRDGRCCSRPRTSAARPARWIWSPTSGASPRRC
jgi:hypothetical protein